MATLNELGKNSASITYNPSSAGADQWPTFATIDKWLRNDTLQGSATTSGTTVTGANSSLYNTQLKGGESILVAGQLRIVQTVLSDTSFTVTQAFSPDITVATSVKIINYTFAGTATNTTTSYASFSNIISGTVAVASSGDSTTVVTGTNTFFMSELTNSVTETQLTGSGSVTVTVGTDGVISGTNSQFKQGTPLSTTFLQVGDSVKIGTSFFIIASVTNDTTAAVTVPPTVAISSASSSVT